MVVDVSGKRCYDPIQTNNNNSIKIINLIDEQGRFNGFKAVSVKDVWGCSEYPESSKSAQEEVRDPSYLLLRTMYKRKGLVMGLDRGFWNRAFEEVWYGDLGDSIAGRFSFTHGR